MTGWSRANFDDLDDAAPEGAAMQWKFARHALDFEQVGISRFTAEPGARMPWPHRHRTQEEGYVVVAGDGWFQLEDERVAVVVGDVLRVHADVARGFEAGPNGLELICVGGPGQTRGDGVLVDDFWG